MEILIVIAVVIAAVVAWKLRVPIMAKVLGQDEARVRRRLNRGK
jgi:hypothetical protein